MAHSDHGNTVPSGQQKQRNAPAGHVVKVVDAVQYGLYTLFFYKWSLQAEGLRYWQ